MSAPTNQWKLGAFVVGAVLSGLAAAVLVTEQALHRATVDYTSYFDEAVTGLELGSPVTFRGVKIGNVSAIDVAPDRRHVEVTYALGVAVLARLGLVGTTLGKETRISVPPNLRVQITSTGLTGTKFLQIDFFDAATAPVPTLPFPVQTNYIPATPSTMKNVEEAVVRAVDQLPALTRSLGELVGGMNALLDEVTRHGLPDKAATTFIEASRLIGSLQAKLDEVPAAALSKDLSASMKAATAALGKLDLVLTRLDGDQGLLSTLQHTSESMSEVAGPRLGKNLEQTGRELREAASAVRQLMEALQRDPDMLLKGRSEGRTQGRTKVDL